MLESIEHGDVLEFRLARPPVNALNPELVETLVERLTNAPREGARAMVLSGQPGMFSAGLDVPALLQLDRQQMREFWKSFYALMGALACSPVPVAAALTGHSPAGGAVMALFCDTRIMADGDFKIGLNEVQVGLPLPAIIHSALVRQVGPHQAERLAVPGRMIKPPQAKALGFVDEVVAADDVVPEAIAWCQGLLAMPPVAMSRTREIARADLARLFEYVDEDRYEHLTDVWFSDETQTTMQALVQSLQKK